MDNNSNDVSASVSISGNEEEEERTGVPVVSSSEEVFDGIRTNNSGHHHGHHHYGHHYSAAAPLPHSYSISIRSMTRIVVIISGFLSFLNINYYFNYYAS